jgi:hypothetical protein
VLHENKRGNFEEECEVKYEDYRITGTLGDCDMRTCTGFRTSEGEPCWIVDCGQVD